MPVTLRLLPLVLLALPVAFAQPPAPKKLPPVTPWGVSSSASAFRDLKEWFPKVAEAGVTTVRLFPEWNGFQNPKGEWKWDNGDALVAAADANGLEINGILMGSPPGSKAAHAFPMDKLDDWSKYVTGVVGRYGKHVRYWEVWNEGNGGFNDGKHTTTDYAKLAVATYDAAKKADPTAKVGLSVASFDPAYLNQTALAMAKAGTPNKFDFLCIHPYEIADGLAERDGEIPFLWMSKQLRDALKTSAKEKADAEIWITEIGRRIEKKKGHEVTEADAAKALVKLYTMALAQGIARVQWFEARDPVGEDAGFGLLTREGKPRLSFTVLKVLAAVLGPTPKYAGWLNFGKDDRGYGFVFEGKDGPVLVAWMPMGGVGSHLGFLANVKRIDPLTGTAKDQPFPDQFEVTTSPVIFTGLPKAAIEAAKANATKPFPWGGDFSKAKAVSFRPEMPNGVYLLGETNLPTVKFPDLSLGVVMQGDINHPLRFWVHPSFANINTKEYHVRVTVRRLAAGNVGMNLFYEVADSQGKSPYANTGKWFGATAADGWQTYTWTVKDACFAKMWGHDFVLRPEQSIPFALGHVEVSTEPFK